MSGAAHERAGPENEKGPDPLAEIEAPKQTRLAHHSTSSTAINIAPVIERVCRSHCWQKFKDGPRHVDEPLTDHHIKRHLAGQAAFGACPIAPGESTTRLALLDFDSHDAATSWEDMRATADRVADTARIIYGFDFVLWRSSGGKGIHLYLLWEKNQEAHAVRETLRRLLVLCELKEGTGGVAKGEIEIFPKQPAVAPGKFGSMFILAGAGESERLTPGDGWPMSDDVPHLTKPERPAPTGIESTNIEELRELLSAIPNEGEKSLSYDDWFRVVCAVHHETGGSDEGLALVEEFSERSEKVDLDFLRERVWNYITSDRENPITGASLKKLVRDSADVSDDFEDLGPESAPGARPRFASLTQDELCARPRSQWLVKGVIPKAELIVIFGQSTAGKSFIALDLVSSIARGVPWRGHRVLQGRVTYVCAEGQGGFRDRLEAYRLHHNAPTGLRTIVDVPNLLREDDVALAKQINAEGGADLIVIDTLAQVSPGGDENSAEAVGRVLAHCRRLHAATGATVLLVHHAGKNLEKGARGWSGLKAAADAELSVERDAEGVNRRLVVSKLKDGRDGGEFNFKLLVVPLGLDEDEDVVTSCVVEHVDAVAPVKKPVGKWRVLVWRAVHELVGRGDEWAPVEELITKVLEGIARDPGAGRDTRRQRVVEAINELAAQGFVIVEKDQVRVP